MCEVPAVNLEKPVVLPGSLNDDIDMLMMAAIAGVKEAYQLSRKKASEILVWL